MLPVEGTGEGNRFRPIDRLNRAPVLGVFHHLEDATLDNAVVQVECLKLSTEIAGMNFAPGSFLGSAVESPSSSLT